VAALRAHCGGLDPKRSPFEAAGPGFVGLEDVLRSLQESDAQVVRLAYGLTTEDLGAPCRFLQALDSRLPSQGSTIVVDTVGPS
jgi:hypothetical protein